jgi:Tfp pilus assembly protein PilX
MKTQSKKSALRWHGGSALLIVLMTTGILSVIALGAYLNLTSAENKVTMRALAWNAALPMAEAGVEEAMSQVSKNINNFAADNWTLAGTNYTKQRTFGDGYYAVSLAGSASTLVTITSTGFVKSPWQDTNYIARTVQVIAQVPGSVPMQVGLSATSISFGGNLGVDSYDSSNPLYSNTNKYAGYDPAKATAQALVALAPPGLNFSLGGSSQVLGSVAVPPGGVVTTKGNASVGDASWNSKGIQPGHFSNTFTNTLPDVVVPAGLAGAGAPSSGTVNGTLYTYVLNGNYGSTSLDGQGSSTSIYVQGNSKVYVGGNINLNQIVFAPGTTLDLYVAASSVSFNPTVVGAMPPQFRVWGLPTCTSMNINGNSSFVGLIYAPEMNLSANGNAAIYGAVSAKSFSCNGTFDFHYDTSSTNTVSASSSGFTIISWAEL